MSTKNFRRNWNDFAISDHHWLVSSEGRAALVSWVDEDTSSPKAIQRLRKEYGVVRARLLAAQLELRRRAKTKFDNADSLFFTPVGLEQATSQRLAEYKAQRFAGISARGELSDICCGIGGDSLSLATHTEKITLIDSDPVCCLYAKTNLEDSPYLEVRTERVGLSNLQVSDSVVHVDPDRRHGERRTTTIEDFSPSVEVLSEILSQSRAAAIKLAPGSTLPSSWQNKITAEWIGENRECKQLVVWSGELSSRPGDRQATAYVEGKWHSVFGQVQRLPPIATEPGKFLYEPHASVLAADLAGFFCQKFGFTPVTSGGGYLTSDERIIEPLIQSFEVVCSVKPKLAAVRKALNAIGGGRVEVKKRGARIDPNQWQKSLSSEGEQDWVIIVYGDGPKEHAVIAQRISNSSEVVQ